MTNETFTIQVIDDCWVLHAPVPLNLAGWIMMSYANDYPDAIEDRELAAYYKAAMAFGSKEKIMALKAKLKLETK